MPNLLFSLCRSSIPIRCHDIPKKELDNEEEGKKIGPIEYDTSDTTLKRPSELPIYCDICQTCTPKNQVLRCKQLEEFFRQLRLGVWQASTEYQMAKIKFRKDLESASAWINVNSVAALRMLRHKDSEYLRRSLVGFSALLGWLIACGGKLQRSFGGLVCGGLATYYCYPREIARLKRDVGDMYEEFQEDLKKKRDYEATSPIFEKSCEKNKKRSKKMTDQISEGISVETSDESSTESSSESSMATLDESANETSTESTKETSNEINDATSNGINEETSNESRNGTFDESPNETFNDNINQSSNENSDETMNENRNETSNESSP